MTKGHTNFGASGLYDFRKKLKNDCELLSFDIPILQIHIDLILSEVCSSHAMVQPKSLRFSTSYFYK